MDVFGGLLSGSLRFLLREWSTPGNFEAICGEINRLEDSE
jgi:hypothetical protein